jgi:hypothetical protein
MGTQTIQISKEALHDLFRVKEELDTIMESLELMENKEFMASYKKAKDNVKKREFDDWCYALNTTPIMCFEH